MCQRNLPDKKQTKQKQNEASTGCVTETLCIKIKKLPI